MATTSGHKVGERTSQEASAESSGDGTAAFTLNVAHSILSSTGGAAARNGIIPGNAKAGAACKAAAGGDDDGLMADVSIFLSSAMIARPRRGPRAYKESPRRAPATARAPRVRETARGD